MARSLRSSLLAAAFCCLVLLLAACSDDADDAAGPTTTAEQPDAPAPDGAGGPAAEPGGWEQVQAPATCRCSDGSPYHWLVRQADPERVLFYLEGGGACFSAETCAPGTATYKRSLAGADPDAAGQGVFAFDDDRNPFADWTVVYVPYCTGDLHLGENLADYGDGVVVDHRGAINAGTALAATATAFPDATDVVVAGSSAGSASAPLYGGMAHDLLPDAEVTVIADASAAYPGDEAITTAIGALWGAFENLPDWPSSADEPVTSWSLPGLFVRAGLHADDLRLATIDNAYDEVQERFNALIGQTGDLRERIEANHSWIEEAGVELHTWLMPGTEHTILPRAALYDTEVDGVALHEWLADLVAGRDVDDVACTDCR